MAERSAEWMAGYDVGYENGSDGREADYSFWIDEHGRSEETGIRALDALEAENRTLQRRVEMLEGDIAKACAQFDRHHVPWPGTWPWERAKYVVDDALSGERD